MAHVIDLLFGTGIGFVLGWFVFVYIKSDDFPFEIRRKRKKEDDDPFDCEWQ